MDEIAIDTNLYIIMFTIDAKISEYLKTHPISLNKIKIDDLYKSYGDV